MGGVSPVMAAGAGSGVLTRRYRRRRGPGLVIVALAALAGPALAQPRDLPAEAPPAPGVEVPPPAPPGSPGEAPAAPLEAAVEEPAQPASPGPLLDGDSPPATEEGAPVPRGALDEGSVPDTPVEVHGFVSQGFIKTTANNYLAESERGSFEMAEAGINITKALGDRLRLGVQLFARDLGPIGDYSAKLDWFYLDYRLNDWLGIRAGRVKLPVGLYNEITDVDAARVPILMPQSIYSVRSRDYLLAQTGFELYGYAPLAGVGALDYRLYLGTIFLDAPSTISAAATNLDVPYVAGGRLLWETPLEGLRLGGSVQVLRLDFTYTTPANPMTGAMAMTGDYKLPVLIWVSSAEYAVRDLLLAAEYSRWRVKIDSTVPLPASARAKTTSERYYVMAAYRLTPWLSPSVYYSGLYVNVEDRDGRDDYQHDLAATLRFDLTANLTAKVEGHLMSGTADLQPNMNDGRSRLLLTEYWGLFLLKLTAFF